MLLKKNLLFNLPPHYLSSILKNNLLNFKKNY